MFFFCFLEAVAQIIFFCLISVNKTGRNVDDDTFVGNGRIHLNLVDIIAVYKNNIIRLQLIGLAFDEIMDFAADKDCDLMKLVVVVIVFSFDMIYDPLNEKFENHYLNSPFSRIAPSCAPPAIGKIISLAYHKWHYLQYKKHDMHMICK